MAAGPCTLDTRRLSVGLHCRREASGTREGGAHGFGVAGRMQILWAGAAAGQGNAPIQLQDC
jgi:hypothetical protein